MYSILYKGQLGSVFGFVVFVLELSIVNIGNECGVKPLPNVTLQETQLNNNYLGIKYPIIVVRLFI